MPDFVLIGGPNGAGKTTAARRLLPVDLAILEFVNADEIARGLSPFNPASAEFAAGRIMLQRIRALAISGQSFGVESTCAGRSLAATLRRCRSQGYRIVLLFLWLPSAQAAQARVARRVAEGGHAVADDVVARRYRSGLLNLRQVYWALSDVGVVYDNADDGGLLVATKRPGAPLAIHDRRRWSMIGDVP